MAVKFDYDYFSMLRAKNPAWRLLCAESAPLMLSFFNRVFIEADARVIPEPELTEKLEDELYFLRDIHGPDSFPRQASDYLRDWSEPAKGWLRRFYAANGDEAQYDLTPFAEKAIAWAASLSKSTFVGTESRLKIIFDLLRQIAESGEEDPTLLLQGLEAQRAELTKKIEAIRRGEIEKLDDTAVRDRFQQFARMARDLLSDFREVEYNFRALDRDSRRKIATANVGKGEILDEVLNQSDSIEESDQGKSFKAFTDFLLSAQRQEELHELLDKTFKMPVICDSNYDRRLARISDSWLDASDHTLATMRLLSAQLRQFLDGRVWLENRRITELLQDIGKTVIELGELPPEVVMDLDVPGVEINLPFERAMFVPASKSTLDSKNIFAADEAEDTEQLFDQFYVDKAELLENIRLALIGEKQLTLDGVLTKHPLTRGLAEVVTYLSLAANSDFAMIDDSHEEEISWSTAAGRVRKCRLPRVIFLKKAAAGGAVHE